MVPMTVANKDDVKTGKGAWRPHWHLPPDDARHVAQERIRQYSNAIEVDQNGRMAEERKPIAHIASSAVARMFVH